jgi:drug/metabolite transporter (DMT)-like permease
MTEERGSKTGKHTPPTDAGGDMAGSGGPGAWATHAALLLVQVAFASQAVEAKIAMLPRPLGGEEIFPESLAMMRMTAGAIFFQVLLRAAPRFASPGRPTSLDVRTHLALAGLSILGISLNQTLFLLGLRWASPFAAALLGATIPVFTAALAVLFRQETLVFRTVAGLVLSISGVLALTGVGSLSTQDAKGSLLLATNCLSYAAYVVLSRNVVLRVGSVRFIAWLFTYGALLFLPIGIGPLFHTLPNLTPRGVLFVTYIVAVPTILAYFLNAWALGRSNATLVTIYIYLQPLLAGLLAWIQLGHAISSRAFFAAILILAGLGLVATRPSRR